MAVVGPSYHNGRGGVTVAQCDGSASRSNLITAPISPCLVSCPLQQQTPLTGAAHSWQGNKMPEAGARSAGNNWELHLSLHCGSADSLGEPFARYTRSSSGTGEAGGVSSGGVRHVLVNRWWAPVLPLGRMLGGVGLEGAGNTQQKQDMQGEDAGAEAEGGSTPLATASDDGDDHHGHQVQAGMVQSPQPLPGFHHHLARLDLVGMTVAVQDLAPVLVGAASAAAGGGPPLRHLELHACRLLGSRSVEAEEEAGQVEVGHSAEAGGGLQQQGQGEACKGHIVHVAVGMGGPQGGVSEAQPGSGAAGLSTQARESSAADGEGGAASVAVGAGTQGHTGGALYQAGPEALCVGTPPLSEAAAAAPTTTSTLAAAAAAAALTQPQQPAAPPQPPTEQASSSGSVQQQQHKRPQSDLAGAVAVLPYCPALHVLRISMAPEDMAVWTPALVDGVHARLPGLQTWSVYPLVKQQ
jgi:hypothetical protein